MMGSSQPNETLRHFLFARCMQFVMLTRLPSTIDPEETVAVVVRNLPVLAVILELAGGGG